MPVLMQIHIAIKAAYLGQVVSLLCAPLGNGDLCHHLSHIVLLVLSSTSVYPVLLGSPEFHRQNPVISLSVFALTLSPSRYPLDPCKERHWTIKFNGASGNLEHDFVFEGLGFDLFLPHLKGV